MGNSRCLALLRGINVGGNNIIKMEALKKTFAEMGCTGVQTYIQSGNVIFYHAEKNRAALLAQIEQALSKQYRYEARLALYTLAEMKKIIAAIPPGFGEEPDTYRYDVWFVLHGATAHDVMQRLTLREGVDQAYRGPKAVYTARLTSQATKSRLTKIIQEPVYQYLTIRNWNTTRKLVELMCGEG